MKKILISISSVVCAFLFLISMSFYGENMKAYADNTSSSKAYDFATLGDGISRATSDSLGGSGTDNWYKFTVTQPGELTIQFSHDIISSTSSYWKFICYQEDATTPIIGSNAATYYFSSNGNEAEKVISGIFLAPGTYYIKVQKGSKYSGNQYSLSLTFDYDNYVETENNSSYALADEIEVNQNYRGKILVQNDADWYKFTLPSDGVVEINFSHAIMASTDQCWRLYLLQNDGVTSYLGDCDTTVTKSWTFAANKASETIGGLGLTAGTYYIRIERVNDSDEIYTLNVGFTATDYAEKESNQNHLLATEVELNQAYTGAISSTSERDWYVFTTDKDGYISVRFDHAVSESEAKWLIYIFHEDGTTYICDESNYWTSTNNDASFATPKVGVAKGTYKIMIRYGNSLGETPYKMTVNFVEADNWEKESNNSAATATDMGTKRVWYGSSAVSSYNGDDADWYKIKLTYSANYTLNLTHAMTGTNKQNVYTVYFYNSDTSKYITYNVVKGNANLEFSLGYLTPGTYYIRVIAGSIRYTDPYCISMTDDHTHAYGSTGTSVSNSVHAQVCTYCGQSANFSHTWNSGTVTTAATCSTDGVKTFRCTVCNHTKTEAIPAAHKQITVSGKDSTCTAEGYTDKICCSACDVVFQESEIIPKKDHIASDWIEKTPLTCTEGAERYKRCSSCGEILEEDYAEALGHNYVSQTIEPTCKTEGYTQNTCSRCGDTHNDNYVPVSDHLMGDWIERTPLTCTEGAERYKRCYSCGEIVEEEYAEALGHNYVTQTIAPTCQAEGYTQNSCTRCDDSYSENFVPKAEHTNVLLNKMSPTCIFEGFNEFKCQNCNLVTKETVEALGHNYEVTNIKPASCVEEGNTLYTCSRCKGYYYGDYTEKTEHTYGEAVTKNNMVIKTCTTCSFTLTEYIKPSTPDAVEKEEEEKKSMPTVVVVLLSVGGTAGAGTGGYFLYNFLKKKRIIKTK